MKEYFMKVEIWEDGHRYILKIKAKELRAAFKELDAMVVKLGVEEEVYSEHDRRLINKTLFGD